MLQGQSTILSSTSRAYQFTPLTLNLNISVKGIAFIPQIYIQDLQGNQVGFVYQKPFKLLEEIEIYSDETKNHLLYNINVNQVTDYGATYYFKSSRAGGIGSTTQDGVKSLWRTEFEVADRYNVLYVIRLNNLRFMLMLDLLVIIPIIGDTLKTLGSYVITPKYMVTTAHGVEIATMEKIPALNGEYEIRSIRNIDESDGELVALSLLTIILMQGRIDKGF